jgi:hypothetical protein
LLAKVRLGLQVGKRWGDLHLQHASVVTVAEMNRDRDVKHELDQAALAAKVEKADEKVEQARKEAAKIRAELSDAPAIPVPTVGGWVRHAGGEAGIQERSTADGKTAFRKRATHLGKTVVSPSLPTLEQA